MMMKIESKNKMMMTKIAILLKVNSVTCMFVVTLLLLLLLIIMPHYENLFVIVVVVFVLVVVTIVVLVVIEELVPISINMIYITDTTAPLAAVVFSCCIFL